MAPGHPVRTGSALEWCALAVPRLWLPVLASHGGGRPQGNSVVQPPRVEGFNGWLELPGQGHLLRESSHRWVAMPWLTAQPTTAFWREEACPACLLLPSPARVPVTVTGGGQRGHRTGESRGNLSSREQCTRAQSDPTPGASAVCLLPPRGSEPSSPVGLGIKQEGSHLQTPQGMESPRWSLVLGLARVLESLPEGDSVAFFMLDMVLQPCKRLCPGSRHLQRRCPPSPFPGPHISTQLLEWVLLLGLALPGCLETRLFPCSP